MGSGKPMQKSNKHLQTSEKHLYTPFSKLSFTPGVYRLQGKFIQRLLFFWGNTYSLLSIFTPGSRDFLVTAFSLITSDTRRWLVNNLEAHFLALLEILRNFLARAKYLKGLRPKLQLQYSFPTLLFSTPKSIFRGTITFASELSCVLRWVLFRVGWNQLGLKNPDLSQRPSLLPLCPPS